MVVKLRSIAVFIGALSMIGLAGLLSLPTQPAHSQTQQLAAQLLVADATVEVKRANTNIWVAVGAETIISAGDQIRTDDVGYASIDFLFVDLTMEIEPATTVRIIRFAEINGQTEVVVQVDQGFTSQIYQAEAATHNYQMRLPGMILAMDNSTSQVRVENDKRSAVLVGDGLVHAIAIGEEVRVEKGFGVRSPVDERLSEVVEALDFGQLDARLDGCSGTATPDGDFSFNVRMGPSTTAPRIGTISANNISRYFGQTADAMWYRIPFGGHYGWFSAELAEIEVDPECGEMHSFADDYVEDINEFTLVGTTNSAIVIVDLANIRIGPGTSYRVVDTAPTGSFLVVNGRTDDNEWLQIYQGDGKLGWVFSGLVRLNVDYSELNIIPIDVLDTTEAADPDESEAETEDMEAEDATATSENTEE